MRCLLTRAFSRIEYFLGTGGHSRNSTQFVSKLNPVLARWKLLDPTPLMNAEIEIRVLSRCAVKASFTLEGGCASHSLRISVACL
jgi:hypothetical protein